MVVVAWLTNELKVNMSRYPVIKHGNEKSPMEDLEGNSSGNVELLIAMFDWQRVSKMPHAFYGGNHGWVIVSMCYIYTYIYIYVHIFILLFEHSLLPRDSLHMLIVILHPLICQAE